MNVVDLQRGLVRLCRELLDLSLCIPLHTASGLVLFGEVAKLHALACEVTSEFAKRAH